MQAFDEMRSKQLPEKGFWLVTTFCKVITRVCFLTWDLIEQNSFKSMNSRWFDPPWFSHWNEIEITFQAFIGIQ